MINVEEYLEMITLKTAVLPSLCSELGAIIAGADDDAVDLYDSWFEFRASLPDYDDILGIWGDESFIGKSVSTDIITGKKTLPILYGLEKSGELRDLYRETRKDENYIRRVVNLLDQTGRPQVCADKAAAYSRSTLSCLEAARPGGSARVASTNLPMPCSVAIIDSVYSKNFVEISFNFHV